MRRALLLLLMLATGLPACAAPPAPDPGPWPPPRHHILHEVYPVHVAAEATHAVECPDAVGNAVRDGATPGLAMTAIGLSGATQGDEYAALAGGFVVATGLVMAGGGAAIGAIVGSGEADAYEVGALELQREMEAIDLDRFFVHAMSEHAGVHGPVVTGDPGSAETPPVSYLDLHVEAARFRICRASGTFCLELVGRATLRPAGATEPTYDRTLVFTSRQGRGRLPAGDRIGRNALTLDVADLDGPSCRAMLRKELIRAVNGLCLEIARDLRGARPARRSVS